MARLVIAAVLVIGVLVAIAAVFAAATSGRRTAGEGMPGVLSERSSMQKVAFFLLIALILYVSAAGGV